MAAIRRQNQSRILLFMTIILQLQRVSGATNKTTQAPGSTNQVTTAPKVASSGAPTSRPTQAHVTSAATASTSAPPTAAPSCTPLTQSAHLQIFYSNGEQDSFPIGTTATFLCDSGYNINNNVNLTCTAPNWNGSVPTCSLKDCKQPQTNIANGKLTSAPSTTTYGSNATYTCNKGYDSHGNGKIVCKDTGQWSTPNLSCTIKDCRKPEQVVRNGNVTYSSTTFGSTATYTCNKGYNSSGVGKITCQASGHWSTTDLKCKIKDCGPPPTHEAETWTVKSNNTTFGSTAKYVCNRGYNYSGNATIFCRDSGYWSVTDFSCTIRDCRKPEQVVLNGNVTYSSTTFGSTAIYACNKGYNPHGDGTIVCTDKGIWNRTDLTCTIKACSSPPNITNGHVTVDATTVNSTANYSCDPGYNLDGNSIISCQSDGTWENKPSCSIIEKGYSESCVLNKQCKTPNSICKHADEGMENGKCLCNGTEFYKKSNDNSCAKRVEYNFSCDAEDKAKDQCKTENAFCLPTDGNGNPNCACDESHYHDKQNDSCQPRPVAPGHIVLYHFYTRDVFTNHMIINWVAPTTDRPTGFDAELEWYPASIGGKYNTCLPWDFNTPQSADVVNLLPGREYTFYLYLRDVKYTHQRTVLQNSIVMFTKPLGVQQINFTDITETSMTVSWANAEDRPCHLYSVSVNGGKVFNVTRSNASLESFQLTEFIDGSELTGGTKYEVTITAVVPHQSSEAAIKSVYTRPEPISDAHFVEIHSNAAELLLEFSRNTTKSGYNIYVTQEIENGDEYIQTENDSVKITGLQSGTMYMFTIYTYLNSDGTELQSERNYNISTYTRPLPPENLTAEDITEDSLKLQWAMNVSNNFDEFVLQYSEMETGAIINVTLNKTTFENMLFNLTSGIKYAFNLYSVVNGTLSEDPAHLNVYTKPAQPEMPQLVDRTDTTVTIQFPHNNNSYDGYIIMDTFYDRGNETIVIKDLSPGTEYTFTIFSAVNRSIKSLDNVTFDSFTLPAPPAEARFLMDELHENSLVVSWNAVTNGGFDGYVVQLYNGSKSVEKNVSTSTRATFENLTSGEKYTVYILSYWNGVLSYHNYTLSTYTRPAAPIVDLLGVTKTSFEFSINGALVDSYKYVLGTNSTKSRNITGNFTREDDSTYTINRLTAGTFYTIRIFSVIGGIEGENVYHNTSYTEPNSVDEGSIVVDRASTTSDKLAIQWTKPQDGDVGWYEVAYMCDSPNHPSASNVRFSNRTTEPKSRVEGLEPGSNCTVDITTHVGNQKGEVTEKMIMYTTNEKAPEKVQDVRITPHPRKLDITWKPPVKPNGVVRRYRVDIVDMKNNCTVSRTIYTCSDCANSSSVSCDGKEKVSMQEQPNCEGMVPVNKEFTTSDSYPHEVDSLHPYKNYTVVVIPYTRCYGSIYSQTIDTLKAAPEGPPTNIRQDFISTTEDTLALSWQPPLEEQRNGIITHYTVTITYKNLTCYMDKEGADLMKSYNVSQAEGGGLTKYSMGKLFPYWPYEVTVSAWTSAGEGKKSNPITMMTNQTTPDKIKQPSIGDKSKTSVKLSWKPPCLVNGVIGDYRIIILSSPNDVDDAKPDNANFTIGSNVTTFEVPGLLPYHNYTFSIAPINTIGQEGESVNTSKARTNPGEPHEPRNIKAIAKSANALDVSWSAPSLYTGWTKYKVTATDSRNKTLKFSSETDFDFFNTSIEVNGLDEYWNYTVTVTAVTSAGQNTSTTNIEARTKEAAPGKIQRLSLSTQTNVTLPRFIHITWQEPAVRDLNGILNRYYITYLANINGEIVQEMNQVSQQTKQLRINGTKPGVYRITVFAATSAGNGTAAHENITVPAGAPIRVQESFSAPLMKTSNKTSAVNDTKTQIAIELPLDFLCDDANGKRKRFGIIIAAEGKANNNTYVGSATGFDSLITTTYKSWRIVQNETEPGPYITSHEDWNPCPAQHTDCKTERASALKQKANHPNVNILVPKCTNDGKWAKAQCNKPTGYCWCVRRESGQAISGTATHGFPLVPPKCSNEDGVSGRPANNRRKRSTSESNQFVIGADGNCAGKKAIRYCNGALKPDTRYRFKAFTCTEGGCSETYYSLPVRTAKVEEPKSNNLPAIVGAVAAAVVFVLVVIALVQMKRRQALCFSKAAEEGNTHRRPSIPLEPRVERPTSVRYNTGNSHGKGPESIRLSDFPEHVDDMKKDSLLKFSDMYKLLKEKSPKHPTTVAESQICRPKNRYTNILPFDHSRVKILPLDDEEGSDYINANYIPGYTSRREYIATQGPMPATFDDFWRMVWEQNVEIIVMLTKLMEKGRNKCDKYWPNQGESQFYGDLSVSIISESNLSDYTIRIMEMKLRNEKRKVKQFSFLKWPDMGCPEYPELLLEFVKSVRQHESRGQSADRDRPMVVHCSAGVGRTGTFIAVDHLLQHIRDHDDIDIYNIVLDMRNNRCHMVQTEDQYVYIHECIREFITNDDDDDDYDDEDDNHLYVNSRQENIYENTGFSKQF